MRNKAKDRKTLKQRLRSWLWGFLLEDGVPEALTPSIDFSIDTKAFAKGIAECGQPKNRFEGIGKLLRAVDPLTTDDNGEELK